MKKIKVFLSSPGDVADERDAVGRVAARLNEVYRTTVEFCLERWEYGFYEACHGFQEGIAPMADFDIVIGILWKRIGTELPPEKFSKPDGGYYVSGTSYEIETAISISKIKSGVPSVYVFKKNQPVFFSETGFLEEKKQKDALDLWWSSVFRDEIGRYVAGYNLFSTIDEFEHKVENLLVGWINSRGYVSGKPVWDVDRLSPFPGLVSYDKDRSQVFFGRRHALDEMYSQLVSTAENPLKKPIVFVIGASGSGKSSLVKAGLIPTIESFSEGSDWRVVVTEPLSENIIALAEALFQSVPEMFSSAHGSVRAWADLAQKSPSAAADSLSWVLLNKCKKKQASGGEGLGSRIIYFIDQCEGILGCSDERVFCDLVNELVFKCGVWLVLALRSDSYESMQKNSVFLEWKRIGCTFDLPPPGASEIADIIMGPARAAGLVFAYENGTSVSEILRSAVPNADALPLLQMTLANLFEMRQGNVLTHAAYLSIGGIEGAIASHANSVFFSMPKEYQKELGFVIKMLVRDVSRASDGSIHFLAVKESIGSFKKDVQIKLIDRFVEGRLLVSDKATVRVAHEALLRCWPPASLVLERMADEVIRRERVRFAVISFAAIAFCFVAIASIVLYESSHRNLMLAMLARAEEYIEDEMPTRAYLLATSASSSRFGSMIRAYLYPGDDSSTLIESIVRMSERALLFPTAVYRFGLAPTSVDAARNGEVVAIGYASGEVKIIIGGSNVLDMPRRDGAVQFVKLSHGGLKLFVVTDQSVYLWDFVKGNVEKIYSDGADITSAAVSNDGRVLALGTKGRMVAVLDVASGTWRYFKNHLNWVQGVAVSGDGGTVASSGDDGFLYIWNVGKSARVVKVDYGVKDVWSIALSPSGKQLVSVSISGEVRVWDINDEESRADSFVLSVGKERLWRGAFSKDGTQIAVSSWLGVVTLFDPRDGRKIGVLDRHDQRVNDLVFEEGGGRLITASNAGSVFEWDVSRIKPLFYDVGSRASEVVVGSYRDDGMLFVGGGTDGRVYIYDVMEDGSLLRRCSAKPGQWIIGVVFVNSGGAVVALSASGSDAKIDAPISLIDVKDCSVRYFNEAAEIANVTSIAAGPGGGSVVLATSDGSLYSLNVDTGKMGLRYKFDSVQYISDVSFGNNGRDLVVGTAEGKVHVVNFDKGTAQELVGPGQVVSAVKFSPGSEYVVAGGKDEYVFVWERNGDSYSLASMLPLKGGVNNVAFSQDGKLLAAGSDDLFLTIWSVGDWKTNFLNRKNVGIRSVYGFNPRNGSLAYDGGRGVVRVLPFEPGNSVVQSVGEIKGLDPVFEAKLH